MLARGQVLFCLVALAMSEQAAAQVVPPATLPGRVERDTAREPQPAPREGLIQIDRSRFAEQAPAGAPQVKLTLRSVSVRGNSAIQQAELQPLWAASLGREISLAEVFAIAGRISALYRDRGYVLSQAVIPQQDLADKGADVRIDVLEGFIDKVTVTGAEATRLQPHLAAVQAERPLTLATLERSLLLINELAGVSAQASLRAGSAPNASDLELVVSQDRRAFSLAAHNRSNPSQGDVRIEAGADFRGVLGAFDRHNIRLVTSGDKKLNLLSYSGEFPLGANGLKAQLGVSSSKSEPDVALANIDSRSDNVSLGVTYPVLRSRQSNFGVRGSITGSNSSSDTAGISTTDDRIRAVRVGFTADYADNIGGISLLDLELAKGLSGLGASKQADLLSGAVPDFTKATVYAVRLQNLGGNWSLLAAVSAQGSSDKLTTAEQFGLGGELFLRAYDPSEVIGENGVAGKIELRFNTSLASWATTLYVYVDSGSVKHKQTSGGDVTTSLSSKGVGVRFSGPARTKGYLEVAKPGKRPVASQGNNDVRAFAGLGIDF